MKGGGFWLILTKSFLLKKNNFAKISLSWCCYPVTRSLVKNEKIYSAYWLAGFTSAEGCFFINLRCSPKNRLGFKVELCFQVSQHVRNEQLMRGLIKLLDCGYIIIPRTRPNEMNFKVTKFQDISNKIIPIFKKYNILGVKALDFADWCKVAELMKEKNI